MSYHSQAENLGIIRGVHSSHHPTQRICGTLQKIAGETCLISPQQTFIVIVQNGIREAVASLMGMRVECRGVVCPGTNGDHATLRLIIVRNWQADNTAASGRQGSGREELQPFDAEI